MATASDIAGRWTYRSLFNDPTPIDGDAKKALDLFFAEAAFDLSVTEAGDLRGTIDWTGGGLDLAGTVAADGATVHVAMVGSGRPGTSTATWRYDYDGWLAHAWPNGVAQVPAIVGSVIRVKPHGSQPAGVVASFIAVHAS